MLLACFYSKNILRVVLFFIPLIVSSAIVGPERIVFISYFFFLYYAVQNNRGINLGVAFTVIYFSVKSCLFLYNIITTGQGFN
jgi:hypothetical protein